jgi:hypothetical protein
MNKDNCTIKEKVIRLKGLLALILEYWDSDEDNGVTEQSLYELIDEELNYPTPNDLRHLIKLRKRVLDPK